MIARILVLSALAALAGPASARPQEELPPEYKVKAQILLRFAERFTWPEKAFNGGTTFRIGVLGDDPFGKFLEEAVARQKTINGRTIELKKDSAAAALEDCQLVFIAGSEEARIDEILKAYKGKPILAMGDTPGFAKNGTAVNLSLKKALKGYNTRYELNREAMKEAGLKADDQLLKGGDEPKPKPKEGGP